MSGNLDRIRELFEVARELDGDDRARFLDGACGDETALREEIESLLAADAGSGSFLSGDGVSRALGEAMADRADSLVGRTVGRYRILDVVARGGMGVVYRAEQTNPDRQVALKVMAPGLLTPEVARRFAVEVQVMGRLQHPGIAQIFEAGTAEIGDAVQPFFAMEFIDGAPLTQWSDQQDLDLHSRLRLLIRVCEGVEHAHRKGVIHRDLKPANILVRRDGQPKILDFGVARGTDVDLQATTVGSGSSGLLGTLAYMSPEQVRGDTSELDTRSDVYSLGVVSCELLTGGPLHDLKGKSITESIRTVAEQGQVALAPRLRSLPSDLATILRKALMPDPAQRYETVSALAADLGRYLDKRPILARPPSTWYHLRKLVSRHRVASVFAGLLLVLLVAGGVVVLDQNRKIRAERDKATVEAATAEQVSDFLIDLFSGPDPRVARGKNLTAREMLDRGAEKIQAELESQPLVRSRLMVIMGRVYSRLGLPEQAGGLLEQGIAAGREILEENPGPTVRGLQELAWVQRNDGRYDEGIATMEEALEIADRVMGQDNGLEGELLLSLGLMQRDKGDLEEARVTIDRALEVSAARHGPRSRQTGNALYHLAWLEHRSGNTEGALAISQQACPILEAVLGENDPAVAWCFNDQSMILSSLKRHQEAGDRMERAIVIWETVLPDGHPHLGVAYSNLGNLYYGTGEYGRALAEYRRALEIRAAALPSGHPDIGSNLCNIAYAEWKLDQVDDAEEHFKEGIAVMEAALGPDDDRVINNRVGLERIYLRARRFEEALGIRNRILESHIRTRGPGDTWVAGALRNRASTYRLMGRDAEAEADLRQAMEIAVAQAPPTSTGRANIVADLALTLQSTGKLDESGSLLDDLQSTFEEAGEGNEIILAQVAFYRYRLFRRQGLDEAWKEQLDRAIELRGRVRPATDNQLLYMKAARESSRELLQQAVEYGYPPQMIHEMDFGG